MTAIIAVALFLVITILPVRRIAANPLVRTVGNAIDAWAERVHGQDATLKPSVRSEPLRATVVSPS